MNRLLKAEEDFYKRLRGFANKFGPKEGYKKIKELSNERLGKKLDEWLDELWPKRINTAEDFQAYKQIHKFIMKKSKVTKEDVFNFHGNLMSISCCEEYDDDEEIWERERKYIESWLKSKGMEVEK